MSNTAFASNIQACLYSRIWASPTPSRLWIDSAYFTAAVSL